MVTDVLLTDDALEVIAFEDGLHLLVDTREDDGDTLLLTHHTHFFKMMEFIHTLCKGIIQGVNQFITNDLASYVPLFIIAAAILVIVKVKDLIQKFRK